MSEIQLGVNIDHVATLRNARGENDPSLIEMLFEVQAGGADVITMHLREDRRHIQDKDIFEVKKHTPLPLNFEMALSSEMLATAIKLKPSSVCLVPEKREELTTEGGLNLKPMAQKIREAQKKLKENNIQLFLFVEPDSESIHIAKETGAAGVELHTGRYARSFENAVSFEKELHLLKDIAHLCEKEKLVLHAGHGLNYQNIKYLLPIQNLREVNIGHSIIAYALKVGLKNAVRRMKKLLKSGVF